MNFYILGYFESDSAALKNDLVKVADQLSEKFRFAYTTAKEVLDKAGQLKYANSFCLYLKLFLLFSKVVVHQPKRLQSKFEDAFTVVEGAADKIKSFIQQKM